MNKQILINKLQTLAAELHILRHVNIEDIADSVFWANHVLEEVEDAENSLYEAIRRLKFE